MRFAPTLSSSGRSIPDANPDFSLHSFRKANKGISDAEMDFAEIFDEDLVVLTDVWCRPIFWVTDAPLDLTGILSSLSDAAVEAREDEERSDPRGDGEDFVKLFDEEVLVQACDPRLPRNGF
jgi:hypothetical protein